DAMLVARLGSRTSPKRYEAYRNDAGQNCRCDRHAGAAQMDGKNRRGPVRLGHEAPPESNPTSTLYLLNYYEFADRLQCIEKSAMIVKGAASRSGSSLCR